MCAVSVERVYVSSFALLMRTYLALPLTMPRVYVSSYGCQKHSSKQSLVAMTAVRCAFLPLCLPPLLQEKIDALYLSTFSGLSIPEKPTEEPPEGTTGGATPGNSSESLPDASRPSSGPNGFPSSSPTPEPLMRTFEAVDERAWADLGRSEPLVLKALIGETKRAEVIVTQSSACSFLLTTLSFLPLMLAVGHLSPLLSSSPSYLLAAQVPKPTWLSFQQQVRW